MPLCDPRFSAGEARGVKNKTRIMTYFPESIAFAIQDLKDKIGKECNYAIELKRALLTNGMDAYYHSEPFGFRKFITDFSVARTLDKKVENRVKLLRNFRGEFSSDISPDSVEIFADYCKAENHSSRMGRNGRRCRPISFSSKFFFIFKPETFIPYDSYAVKALRYDWSRRPANYGEYLETVTKLAADNLFRRHFKQTEIQSVLDSVPKSDLAPKFNESVAYLRLMDKYLWHRGDTIRSKF